MSTVDGSAELDRPANRSFGIVAAIIALVTLAMIGILAASGPAGFRSRALSLAGRPCGGIVGPACPGIHAKPGRGRILDLKCCPACSVGGNIVPFASMRLRRERAGPVDHCARIEQAEDA
jgi:hypothetical protein